MAKFVFHDREKLINAIVFFAHNMQHLNKVKLFKLLYLLDFEHFGLTGCSVTNLSYCAKGKGPVPIALEKEWKHFKSDLEKAIQIESNDSIIPKVAFDDSHFTKRELRLMAQLVEQYKTKYPQDLIEVTHDKKGAWYKVWNNSKGRDAIIPYELSISADHPYREAILENAYKHDALRKTQNNEFSLP
jgi:hypothetical protein